MISRLEVSADRQEPGTVKTSRAPLYFGGVKSSLYLFALVAITSFTVYLYTEVNELDDSIDQLHGAFEETNRQADEIIRLLQERNELELERIHRELRDAVDNELVNQ